MRSGNQGVASVEKVGDTQPLHEPMRARPRGEPSVSNKAYIVEAAFFFLGAFFFFLAVFPALFCAA